MTAKVSDTLAALVLLRPARIRAHLELVRASGRHGAVPNAWQLALGVVRMWVRLATRPETVGTSSAAVRPGLAAHHDGTQALYDLEILASRPGALGELRAELAAIVDHDTPRGRWLRDLTVFDGYHEHLLALVDDARAGRFGYDADDARDPDVSFSAYLAWCAAQPPTPAATLAALRAGALDLGDTRI